MTLAIVSEVEYKKGARVQGHFCTLEDGQVIYLAKRKHGQIFRSGRASISAAMVDEQACWALDEMLLYNLRAKKIALVGVRTIDTRDVYLTELKNFFDHKKSKPHNYEGIGGGSRQRALPLGHFTLAKGAVELPLDAILAV